jgi:hypothetical protein
MLVAAFLAWRTYGTGGCGSSSVYAVCATNGQSPGIDSRTLGSERETPSAVHHFDVKAVDTMSGSFFII